MFVEERMSRPVISIHPEMPLQDALNLMHKEHIRRLPVVDKKGKLVGIVSERDLLHASPSDATSLNGSVFVGVDSYVGPIYLAAGFAEGGQNNFYLFIGSPPR